MAFMFWIKFPLKTKHWFDIPALLATCDVNRSLTLQVAKALKISISLLRRSVDHLVTVADRPYAPVLPGAES